MPPYRVEIQRSAERDLSRLAESVFERVTARIALLAGDPRPSGSQKLTGLSAYRVRVGDYRIIYEVSDASRTVIVTRVRHRRDAYRRLR